MAKHPHVNIEHRVSRRSFCSMRWHRRSRYFDVIYFWNRSTRLTSARRSIGKRQLRSAHQMIVSCYQVCWSSMYFCQVKSGLSPLRNDGGVLLKRTHPKSRMGSTWLITKLITFVLRISVLGNFLFSNPGGFWGFLVPPSDFGCRTGNERLRFLEREAW